MEEADTEGERDVAGVRVARGDAEGLWLGLTVALTEREREGEPLRLGLTVSLTERPSERLGVTEALGLRDSHKLAEPLPELDCEPDVEPDGEGDAVVEGDAEAPGLALSVSVAVEQTLRV